ncbi:MAG: putative DNA binding domain-containing protein [Methanomassiliicoccaceae archaeon]|nr:putative DNA binding domain-containing protein [Methanomassiliicoccaceae archaeon]
MGGKSMESEQVEWKESWSDNYLETICAFANSQSGGRLDIGKNDKGETVGVRNAKKLLEEIPNAVKNLMNFHPTVEAVTEGGKTYIVITIKPQEEAVDLRGAYYKRSGSTTVKVTGRDLKPFIMEREGLVWTNLIADNVGLKNISSEAVSSFVKLGQKEGRISSSVDPDDKEGVLRRYELMTDSGITNAAALLFSDRPTGVSQAAVTKIGLFAEEGGRLLMEDIIDGPVILQPEETLKRLLDKYTQPRFRLKNHLERVYVYRYPPAALREAILNAVIHRQYMSVQHTTISVFPDSVEIHNPGKLPDGWTAEDLFAKHKSEPANPLIAQAFHDTGQIERWGVGVSLIKNECEKAGIPQPVYEIGKNGISVIFRSGPWSDTGEEVTEPTIAKKLTPLEYEIYKAIAEGRYTTAEDMAASSRSSVRTVKSALYKLRDADLIQRVGSDKKGTWELVQRPADRSGK